MTDALTQSKQAILNGLTAAQKDALLGTYSFTSPLEEEDGEIALVEAGLWNMLFGLTGADRLTPLGLLLRTTLLQANRNGK